MKLKINIPLILFLAVLPVFMRAQSEYLPMNQTLDVYNEKQVYSVGSGIHSSIRPFIKSDTASFPDTLAFHDDFSRNKFGSYLISLTAKDAHVNITPLINTVSFVHSGEAINSFYLANGAQLNAGIGDNWHLRANYLYSHSVFSSYFRSSIENHDVIPALGRINRYGNNEYFNNYFDGYVSFSPGKVFNYQLGVGRNFFGDGYRSMLLSDYAFNYPYLKVSTTFWKLKYVNLYALQYDISNSGRPISTFRNKFSSTHYFSISIGKRWQIGLFESIVWRAKDSLYNRNFDVNYLNPVIFFRPVEYSVGSPDNVLIGLNVSYKLARFGVLYGQLLIDEFYLSELRAQSGWWANKFALQAGMKVFAGKQLSFQGELNMARPYTYTHSAVQQNYGHFNQPLAHPLGANFGEAIFIANYHKKRFVHQAKFIAGAVGTAISGANIGQDIYQSSSTRSTDYGNELLQGVRENIYFADFNSSYVVNPTTGLMLTLGVQQKLTEVLGVSSSATHLYFGIRTGIFNRYVEY